ncbi:MAG TPA: hypothetical protein VMF13_11020 [Luteitalea sp.]|nr:hypothetical protein [Luteitalea sp.]
MHTRPLARTGLTAFALTAALAVPGLAQSPAVTNTPAAVAVDATAVPAGPVAYIWRGHETEIEAFLRTAPVVRWKDIPVGITKPRRGYFEPGGPATSFAWKPLPTQVMHGKMESYKSEIAAYLLSRHLGMDVVPPVVERQIGASKGAAVYWIENVRPWNPATPPKGPGARWSRQTSRMQMFDQLIANIDRNQGNLLHDDAGHVYLIDHSRAFGTNPTLGTVKPPSQFDRALWLRMAALTKTDLETALKPWLTSTQIDALLSRRNEMRRHIDRLVGERGDEITFLPADPEAVAVSAR